jgi:hypothetical protein
MKLHLGFVKLKLDDYSKCYLPHMDFENGELMSLNINIKNLFLSEELKKFTKFES